MLEKVKSRDHNIVTLNRTVRHFQDNGVDLDKYPMSMGPLLAFDPQKEVFTNSDAANKILHREYREPFVCPTADKAAGSWPWHCRWHVKARCHRSRWLDCERPSSQASLELQVLSGRCERLEICILLIQGPDPSAALLRTDRVASARPFSMARPMTPRQGRWPVAPPVGRSHLEPLGLDVGGDTARGERM